MILRLQLGFGPGGIEAGSTLGSVPITGVVMKEEGIR